jgi:hypothetical protein
MIAKEALQLSMVSCSEELESIFKQIDEAASNGLTEIIIKSNLRDGTLEKLLKDGFKLETEELKHSCGKSVFLYTKIYWSELFTS